MYFEILINLERTFIIQSSKLSVANLESQYLQLNAFNWEITFAKKRTEENISDSSTHDSLFSDLLGANLSWDFNDLKSHVKSYKFNESFLQIQTKQVLSLI